MVMLPVDYLVLAVKTFILLVTDLSVPPFHHRHLDYFEMLRNDDELALARRFESVS